MKRELIDSYRRCTCTHIAAMHTFDLGAPGCRICDDCLGFEARPERVADR